MAPQNKDNQDDRDSRESPPKLPIRSFAIWLLLLALFITMYTVFSQGQTKYQRFNFKPEFVQLVKDGKVRTAEVVSEGPGVQYIRGELTELDEVTKKPKKFRVDVLVGPYLEQWMFENVDNYKYKPQNPYLREILAGAIPFIIILGLLYFLFIRQMRMAGKGAMSFGKSRAKLLTRTKNRITFNDVAGAEEAQEEVAEIIDFLKDPKKFQKLGGRIPKGVMLVGPPGTGKTLLAKAIAGEAEVPFFSISGSDFVEMFVGVGASRVRDMFEQGKKSAPCIIFIDEIDAVGRSRFSGIGGGHDEREQTLNALLVEMDGFDTQEGVIIIAATNRPDVLDNALMRPGRFDRQIVIDLPTLEGRESILKIHSRKVKLAANLNLKTVARGTPGFSGADLANLVNEAALLAARRGANAVELADLEEARDKVRFGTERKSRMMDDKEKILTAYHEAGHAIVLECLEEAEPVHKVTIIPRGASLGSTMQLPEKDRYTQGRKKLLAMLIGFMGGRAAEELMMDDITTGAANDLKQSTRIARAMVCQFGMSDELGPQAFGSNEEHLWLGREVVKHDQVSEQTTQRIDEEVSKLLNASYEEAMQILVAHKEQLELMKDILLEQETIDGQEVREIVKYNRILSPEERAELEPDAVVDTAPEAVSEEDADAEKAASPEGPETPPYHTPPEASPA